MSDSQDPIEEHDDLDADQLVEDAGELFGAKDHSEPVAEADAPPPG